MKPVHTLTLAEAHEALDRHLPTKPAAPWSSPTSEAWRSRKALLELWILLESRHRIEPQEPPVVLAARTRRPRRTPSRNRHSRRSGVIA